MVNRSVGNSCIGNNGIDEILKDRPHLATLNMLIVGCTKQNAKERLRAEKAMVLCGKLTKEFMDEWLLSFMVITKNLELLDYSYKKVKCLRLIGLTLADLTPMLGAIRDYYNQYGVFSQDGERRAVDPEVMQPLINAFWNEIMTTKSEEWEALTRDIVCESDSDDPEFESESE
ncbi:unnamed protein product, partial [Mesorhabditis spiculigera]